MATVRFTRNPAHHVDVPRLQAGGSTGAIIVQRSDVRDGLGVLRKRVGALGHRAQRRDLQPAVEA